MTRSEYLKAAQDAYDSGKVSAEAYDSMLMNVDVFCEPEDECYDESIKITESINYDDERLQELIDNIKMYLDDEDVTIDAEAVDENDVIVSIEVYSNSGEYVGSWELDLDLYDDVEYASSIADEINAVDVDDTDSYVDDDGYGSSGSISHRDVSRWTTGNYYGEGLDDDEWVEPELGEFVEEYGGFNIYKGTDHYGDEIYRCFFVDDDEPEVGYEEWEEATIEILKEWIDSYEDYDNWD